MSKYSLKPILKSDESMTNNDMQAIPAQSLTPPLHSQQRSCVDCGESTLSERRDKQFPGYLVSETFQQWRLGAEFIAICAT
ncbi:unnamed protein product [Timema podura]|uniref:Uncharacterized protein n=1 Tax=Timema podura TaxID=61482 RepID=A0ABN7PH26_TIMPD|nr:unnamed protein product [Timema podura]